MRSYTLILFALAAVEASAVTLDLTPNFGYPRIGQLNFGSEAASFSILPETGGVVGAKVWGTYTGGSGLYITNGRCKYSSCNVGPSIFEPEEPPQPVGNLNGQQIRVSWDFTATFNQGSTDRFGFQLYNTINSGTFLIADGTNFTPGQMVTGATIVTLPVLPGADLFWFAVQLNVFAIPELGAEETNHTSMTLTVPNNSLDVTGVAAPTAGVPEPGTWAAALTGLALLAARSRKR
jgi:hypothetical protein